MKRLTGRIVISLFLGAVTTWGVAWWCALSIDVYQSYTRATALVNGDTEIVVAVGCGQAGAARWSSHQRNYDLENQPSRNEFKRALTTTDSSPYDLLPYWGNLSLDGVVLGPSDGLRQPNAQSISKMADARGWPMLAMWCEHEQKRGVATSWRYDVKSRGIALSSDWPGRGHPFQKALPLAVIWPGFAFDTVFFAVIWFGLLFGFTTVRRFVRRQRGRCPKCGYDLRSALEAGCPECGWGRAEDGVA